MGSMISLPRKLLPLALFLLASCSTLQVDEEVLERITHQDEYEDSLSIEVADSEGLGDKIREDLDIEEAAPKTEPKPKEGRWHAKRGAHELIHDEDNHLLALQSFENIKATPSRVNEHGPVPLS